jgi:hypothetical protein
VVRERGGGSPGALRIPNGRSRTARTTQTVESRCGAGLVRLQTLSAAAHILPLIKTVCGRWIDQALDVGHPGFERVALLGRIAESVVNSGHAGERPADLIQHFLDDVSVVGDAAMEVLRRWGRLSVRRLPSRSARRRSVPARRAR